MVSKSLLVLLLVTTVLVLDTEAGWGRLGRTIGRVAGSVGRGIGRVAGNAGRAIGRGVGTAGRAIANAGRAAAQFLAEQGRAGRNRQRGKRSVDSVPYGPQAGPDSQFLSDLQQACPGFGLDPSTAGLNNSVIVDSFVEADVNKDGVLSGTELEFFENIIESLYFCVGMLRTQKIKHPNGV